MRNAFCLLLAGMSVPLSFQASGQGKPAELVANGRFTEVANGWAASWQQNRGATLAEADGNRWLRLEGTGATSNQRVELKPEWWTLRLTMRMRTTDVVLGDEGWKDARLAMSFHAADGTRVGNWPNVFHAVGSTDWTVCERDYAVPRGAAYLMLNPANFGTQGSVEFDDVRIGVVRERALAKADAPLPEGVSAPWDTADAWRVDTGTQGRLCLNGLWAFRPVVEPADAQAIPAAGDCWGWFKVPGVWPAGGWTPDTSVQTVHLAPWLEESFAGQAVDQAWYRRTLAVPAGWSGRRLWLEFTMLQTHAAVHVDGRPVGEVWYPGGRLEVTEALRGEGLHEVALLVTARPLATDAQVFMAPDRVVQSQARVELKGVTGDLFLASTPPGDAVRDVRLEPAVRDGRLGIEVGVEAPRAARYRLEVEVSREGTVLKRFAAEALELREGRLGFTAPWADPPLWDVDRPEAMLTATVTLLDEAGAVLDRAEPVRFGFREVRIEGRDILLNGTPIHLRALHNVTSNSAADRACHEGARRTLLRMRQYGFNFLIEGNYDTAPGEVSYLDGLLDAADETGMLVSITLPHVKDFNWKLDDAIQAARYRSLCEWIIRRVQNHPSVILYAMNHNATGYYGDQNPLKMDGTYDPDGLTDSLDYKGDRGRSRRRAQAQAGADIARAIDPSRPIYHHQSGNLGDMHTVNIYLNWAPMQERSDWLAHWATAGRKPMFFVEWGLPHISSWSSYRGPEFIWRCQAFQSAWVPEFAAAYGGASAYRDDPGLRQIMDYEEELWARGQPFNWGMLAGQVREQDRLHTEVMAQFAADNWRSHRAWGISAMLPWDQEHLWRRVAPTPVRTLPDRFANLHRPGIVPDLATADGQYVNDTGAEAAFEPTALGTCFRRWNLPLCAFIGGRTDGHSGTNPVETSDRRFTEKAHTLLPGATLRKSLVILNDTRRARPCRYTWRLVPGAAEGQGEITVAPGGRAFVALTLALPAAAPAGLARLTATFDFGNGETQQDEFRLDMLSAQASSRPSRPVWLLDPSGSTAACLDRLGIRYRPCDAAGTGVEPGDVVIIGEGALSTADLATAPLPVASRVADGARLLLLAQDEEVLARRLAFRTQVHGLRYLYRRAPQHPALAGLDDSHFANWAGSSNMVPPSLDLPALEEHDPTWDWCGYRNTRVWRCGTLGSVASVLIEKPSGGDWRPLLDGGFDLQYAPLLETSVGKGRLVFCQLDAVRRTEPEPVADRLLCQLLAYLETAAPAPGGRTVLYRGDDRGREALEALGVAVQPCPDALTATDALVVAGPGSVPPSGLRESLSQGSALLCLGLPAAEVKAWLPDGPAVADGKADWQGLGPTPPAEFAGLSDADVHWRTRPTLGVLAGPGHPALRAVAVDKGVAVLCQAAPWTFDADAKPYLRTTARRTEFLLARLLANLGASLRNPVLDRLASSASPWEFPLPANWVGREDREGTGRAQEWWQPAFDAATWKGIAVPGTFESQRPDLADYDGHFWYRLRFTVPDGFTGADVTLSLGGIDDESWIWLNGEFLGEVTKATNPKDYWQFPREYRLRQGLLQAGAQNVIAVLVNDTYRTGGILGQPVLRRPAPWLKSYYVQAPQPGDDPYRYYRW